MLNNKLNIDLLIVFLFAIFGFITGCQDQLLDKKPRAELTQASFFETEDHAIQATNATYEQLRQFNVHSFPWLGLTDIASDDAVKGSTPSDATFLTEIDQFTFNATNGAFSGPWQAYYQGIYRANLAIKNIPGIDMNETLRNRLVAENKFLRAYYYFFLVRAFGGVPLVTEPLEPGQFRQPRASASEVYGLIEQDLQDASNILPLKSEYSDSDLGRATKGAAQGMLAKVHLFQQEYQEAQDMAEAVINSGEYSLYPDYGGIFTPAGENSSESLFEIQAVAVETGLGGTPYSVVQGVRGTPNLGWGFNNPNRDLLNSYEPGDPRLGSTMLFVHENLPRGPEDVVRDNPNMQDERYNQKPFLPLNNPGGNFNGGSNIRRLRYADVVLIAAEAAFHNDNTSDAQQYVNMIRTRARGDQSATIGAEVESLAGLVADTLNLSSEASSPFLRFVTPDGAGDNAGLESFEFQLANNNSVIVVNNIDIVQSVDGVSVETVGDFEAEMESKSPGQDVVLEILRVNQSFSGGSRNTNTQIVVNTVTTEQLLPDITATGQQLLDAIWHERRVELAMEQQRFFDLQRQGRAGELLRAQGKNYEDGKHNLYPIPQNEMDLNPMMEQNPGY